MKVFFEFLDNLFPRSIRENLVGHLYLDLVSIADAGRDAFICAGTKRKAQHQSFHIWIQTFFVSVKNLTLPIHLPATRYFHSTKRSFRSRSNQQFTHTIPLSIFTAIRLALEYLCPESAGNHSGLHSPVVSSSSVLNDCKVNRPNISSWLVWQSGPSLYHRGSMKYPFAHLAASFTGLPRIISCPFLLAVSMQGLSYRNDFNYNGPCFRTFFQRCLL